MIPILNRFSSFPRMRESRQPLKNWIPAFAGMTNSVVLDLKKIKPIGKRYEVAALPILLRRLGEWLSPGKPVMVPTPIRVRRDRFLNRDEEFRRMLLLAAAKCGAAGWILVLLDADDDCPAELGPRILERAQRVAPHRPISVVLAKREFEA